MIPRRCGNQHRIAFALIQSFGELREALLLCNETSVTRLSQGCRIDIDAGNKLISGSLLDLAQPILPARAHADDDYSNRHSYALPSFTSRPARRSRARIEERRKALSVEGLSWPQTADAKIINVLGFDGGNFF